jgi:hypothetical protein
MFGVTGAFVKNKVEMFVGSTRSLTAGIICIGPLLVTESPLHSHSCTSANPA